MINLHLPEPIAAYFDADRRDGESVARCFTNRAVVKDEGQTHSGLAAITAWKSALSTSYSYTSIPFSMDQKDGRYIVKSRLTGNFPRCPVDLRFAFRLERETIASLEITP